MADIETSVVISANTDDLQSAMEAASNSVETAADAIRAQFAGLGAAAQQVQVQISTASAQVGSSIGALQSRTAGLAGSIGDGMIAGPGGAEVSSPPKPIIPFPSGRPPVTRRRIATAAVCQPLAANPLKTVAWAPDKSR